MTNYFEEDELYDDLVPAPRTRTFLEPDLDVNMELQEAVNTGCLTISGSDTNWNWYSPILLKRTGIPEHEDLITDSVDIQVLPNIYYDEEDPGSLLNPPGELVDKVWMDGWFYHLSAAFYKVQVYHAGKDYGELNIPISASIILSDLSGIGSQTRLDGLIYHPNLRHHQTSSYIWIPDGYPLI